MIKNKIKYYPSTGNVINDVIYKRPAPNILNELKKVNPVAAKWSIFYFYIFAIFMKPKGESVLTT